MGWNKKKCEILEPTFKVLGFFNDQMPANQNYLDKCWGNWQKQNRLCHVKDRNR